jgi:hypothetical protein
MTTTAIIGGFVLLCVLLCVVALVAAAYVISQAYGEPGEGDDND